MDGVVVSDEDLLSPANVLFGGDRHDPAEPGVVQLGEAGVGLERVARLVPQRRSVPLQTLRSLGNVEARISRQSGIKTFLFAG